MPTLADYPETCRQSIKVISDSLKTDYQTAYAMMLLEAALYDLYPSDNEVLNIILDDVEECECG